MWIELPSRHVLNERERASEPASQAVIKKDISSNHINKNILEMS